MEEVIGIMHTNVENVLERDRKLGDLEERADALQDGCAQFEKQVRGKLIIWCREKSEALRSYQTDDGRTDGRADRHTDRLARIMI